MPGAERQPAALVVLQAVARPLYLDHPVAALLRVELDQIGHARPVRTQIRQQALEPQLQVPRGQAVQRLIEQLLTQRRPVDKGRLNTLLVLPGMVDALAVAVGLQQRQAVAELLLTALIKIGAVQVHRSAVKRVEEGAGQGMEDRVPAEQAEQAGDQGVLHVMHRRLAAAEVFANRQFHAQWMGAGQGQLDQPGVRLTGDGLHWLAEPARQSALGAPHQLQLGVVLGSSQCGLYQIVGLPVLLALFQNTDLPLAGTFPAAALIERQGCLQLIFPFQLPGQGELQPRLTTAQPGVRRWLVVEQGDHLAGWQAVVQCLTALMQVAVAFDIFPALKTPGIGGERHFFIAEYAQLGQDEFLPALPQVAEEHQPQALTQLAHAQGKQCGLMLGAPVAEGAGVRLLLRQQRNQLRLA